MTRQRFEPDEIRRLQALAAENGIDLAMYPLWTPRRDQPDRGDEQTAFVESKHPGITYLLGGNGAGCLHRDEQVFDPVAGRLRTVSKIEEPFHVWARDSRGSVVIARASQPRIYGREKLYAVSLSNGQTIRVTMGHRVLTAQGWREVGDIVQEERAESLLGQALLVSSRDALPSHESCCDDIAAVQITAVQFIEEAEYWDFSVEEHENYWMGGIWNHNTTTTALFKAAKFMLDDQIAPRRDTPFWIIAETYEQVMEACWKEKLYGMGLIPECEIDWDRIQWYRPNDNWPFRVPLKPHPKHPQSNWVIEFKSYKQGRSKMQARSIGGFLFVEQFPWGILEEVVRGCREYAFLGNKLAEFTPVDPSKTVELQEMIERNTLPASDHVYYANTECAVEAGHVTQQWFDQFFGMVPPGMRECRMRGKFGAFEGAIYPMFDPKVHEVTDEDIAERWGDAFADGVFYRRTIDWGAGPSNAFVNLWYYARPIRDPLEPAKVIDWQYYVFDEYYSTDQSRTTVNHLVEVLDRSKAWGWQDDSMWYGTTYADPSSPDRIRIASKLSDYVAKDRSDIKGISITPANNSVMEGIEHVQYLMLPSASLGGQCRLYINRDRCPHLCSELKRYRWATASETGPDAPKQPFKKDDHTCDALRYGTFTEASRSLSGSTIKRVAKQHSERASMRFRNSGRQQIEGVR